MSTDSRRTLSPAEDKLARPNLLHYLSVGNHGFFCFFQQKKQPAEARRAKGGINFKHPIAEEGIILLRQGYGGRSGVN